MPSISKEPLAGWCRSQTGRAVMVHIQIIRGDNADAFADSQRGFEFNVMRLFITDIFLQSDCISGDARETFRYFTVEGTELNWKNFEAAVVQSPLLVTDLSPLTSHYEASKIAYVANDNVSVPKEATLKSGLVSDARSA